MMKRFCHTLLVLALCAALTAFAACALAEVATAPVDEPVGEIGDESLWTQDIAAAEASAAGEAAVEANPDPVDIEIDTYFPDEDFRYYISTHIDRNRDGFLSPSERAAVTALYNDDIHAYSLAGIQCFDNLQRLVLGYDPLQWLDVSGMPELNYISGNSEELVSVNARGCISLKTIYLTGGTLHSLNVRECDALEMMLVSGERIGTLDVHGLPSLQEVRVTNVEKLIANDCPSLKVITNVGSGMTSLNVKGCSALETLDVSDNNLTELDVSNLRKLTSLNCTANNLSLLNARNCVLLTTENFQISGNQAMDLNIRGCDAMESIVAQLDDLQLKSLDARDCDNLLTVWFDHQFDLTTIDLRNCPALQDILCCDNATTALRVANCPSARTLVVTNSSGVKSIDITGCTLLLKAANHGCYFNALPHTYTFFTDEVNTNFEISYKIKLKKDGEILPFVVFPEEIHFTRSSTKLALGDTLTLDPVRTPKQATPKYTWKSSDRTIAKVSAEGVVTPLKKGTTTITATSKNGCKASIDVVVYARKPTDVAFQKASYKVALGKTLKLKPVLTPAKAETTYTWTTSNKAVAKVNRKGVVTPVKPGTATITVKTANGKTAQTKVKVVRPQPTAVDITADTKVVKVGAKLTLGAALTPEYAERKLTWSSANTAVATVNSKGVVTGVKAGRTDITVTTANGCTATVRITVKK